MYPRYRQKRIQEWIHPVTGCTEISCMSTDIAFKKTPVKPLKCAACCICFERRNLGRTHWRQFDSVVAPRRFLQVKVSFAWKLLRCSVGAPCRLRHRPVDGFLSFHSDLFDSAESSGASCVSLSLRGVGQKQAFRPTISPNHFLCRNPTRLKIKPRLQNISRGQDSAS